MIIINDRNFPLILCIMTDFQELEYKTLIKNLDIINSNSIENQIYINLHIDLYKLQDYSVYYFKQLMTYLYDKHFPYLNCVTIFLNKTKKNFLAQASYYIVNHVSSIPFRLIELDKPKPYISKLLEQKN